MFRSAFGDGYTAISDDIEYFTIMGIDPGSRNLGIAIFYINMYTLEIIEIIPIPISLNKYFVYSNNRSSLTSRLFYLRQEFKEILEAYNPVAIAIESGFINPRMPGAVIPLASAITIMSSVIMKLDMDISIIDYPPSIIKKAVGANPLGNKSPVFNALSRNKEIKSIVNLDLLTEHCVDSIAIAYTMLIEIRKEGIICLI